MNEKRYSALRSVVATGMNAAARLRTVEDALRRAGEDAQGTPPSLDEERCRILREELRGIVEEAGLPPEITRAEEAIAHLLGDCAVCSRTARGGRGGVRMQKGASAQSTAPKAATEEGDDWVELAKKPSSTRKAASALHTAESGIRRLVIRKSSRTQK